LKASSREKGMSGKNSAGLKLALLFEEKEKNHTCRRCKKKFNFEETGVPLCSYCFSVVLGETDEDWFPEINLDSIKRGFHSFPWPG
jgi:ribosomal protein L37AE/L43A